MKFKKIKNGYVVKLEKGEEIIESLTKFCRDNNIKAGFIAGIGAADNVVLKYYNKEKKEYLSKKFSGESYEIISLSGNISLLGDKPFLHVHIALSQADYKVFGGHLGSADITVTGEIIITSCDSRIKRKLDNDFGLNLFDLPN